MTTITQRFNAVRWHDSKLLAMCICREGQEELVKLSLQLLENDRTLKAYELKFRNSTYVKMELDLDGKNQCSDDISDAECMSDSEWLRALSTEHPYDHFDGYLHFRIDLIPPGGVLHVLAKDFSLVLIS